MLIKLGLHSVVLDHMGQAGLACHSSLQGLEFLSVLEEWGNHERWERKEAVPLVAWAQSVKEEPFLLLVCVYLSCTEAWLLISWGSSASTKGRPVGEGCLLKGSQGARENAASSSARPVWNLTPMGLLSLLPTWALLIPCVSLYPSIYTLFTSPECVVLAFLIQEHRLPGDRVSATVMPLRPSSPCPLPPHLRLLFRLPGSPAHTECLSLYLWPVNLWC